MKKNLVSVLACVLICALLVLVGCDEVKCAHSYSNWTTEVEPDCTHEGSKSRTCSKCGEKEVKAIPAAGHNFVDGVCTVCGEHD